MNLKPTLFQKYLDEVLPDKDKQKYLLSFVFIKPSVLKLKRCLFFFGVTNGKSVFFEILNAL
jgi:putative DNA primase/helicase